MELKNLKVYTVGHSNRSFEEFLRILRYYKITAVIDVRSFPTSRKFPWFCREYLAKELPKSGIKYIWLGKLLGGYRKGGYEEYMKSRSFKDGIEKLLEISSSHRVAIMCKERLWFKCHRRHISDVLKGLGVEVEHIIDIGKVYSHKRTRFLKGLK
ncbi:MAG: DUF488 domain-containing protein [Thermoprotei archaeon]|nr:MAG: DUF488 domain-containing protein [Thermoprotei archaeon]RLF02723.1 MAG: DUF488 domain-containing protein [Thermoprotei archaeon]